MIKFDWLSAYNKHFFFDQETSKVWETIDVEPISIDKALYQVGYDHQFLTLEGAKDFVERKFSKYGKVERESKQTSKQENQNSSPC